MKSPKPQPKSKARKARTPAKTERVRMPSDFGVHPAFIRLPRHPIPLGECPPINHPRGKDGGWGH